MSNPILAFSARRRMRSVRTPILVAIYSLLLAVMVWVSAAGLLGDTITLSNMRAGVDAYVLMLGLQFLLTVLVTPAMTAGAISGERERQTLDLLLTTNTNAAQIALGKLLESFFFVALMILSTLPMLFVVLMTGGITVTQILIDVLFMLVMSFAALSIGLFCSALFKRTITATVVSYLAVFAIGVGTLLVAAFAMRGYGYEDVSGQLTRMEALQKLPKIALLNPGLAFLCLMADHTSLMESTFSMLPSGYMIFALLKSAGCSLIAWINMVSMTVIAVALTLVSATLVRARGKRPGRKGA